LNIFYLAENPAEAARYHCDKHVVKMILESAQLLSTAHHELDGDKVEINCYKSTHKNHPSAVWARQTTKNYSWLWDLTKELCKEYTMRYGKIHKVAASELLVDLYKYPKNLKQGDFQQPPQCMPDEYKVLNNSVEAYRNYYLHGKKDICKWQYTHKPYWYYWNE
jgi:hypothetical protein